MKTIFFTILLASIIIVGYSQERKKLYFVADTAAINHDKRLSITYGSPFERTFIFNCDCIGKWKGHFNVVTRIGKKFPEKLVRKCPSGEYIGIDELIKLVVQDGYSFDVHHELVIVEPLKGKYRVSNVKREVLPPPSDDTIYIH
ncbi:hypothetical protein [Pedobacter sp. Leaf194]|uniref:hypothetical protein n=1 Tax=Pedobacter sp. Leaf194 TaxID=1736297 RepID=UPI000702AE30|nr:hypothetical protein [Pedobacter sp. Leaf194]KQS35238.1 hypothetical protein ASG14_13640 [Pedobacter sp. Leaf194]